MDFDKLRAKKRKSIVTDPIEIFRRLPKPDGMNDLYLSQAEVLKNWYENRNQKDVLLKLHTGGGKTLVGLLAAQSILNEYGGPVLYLTPTIQLVNQTIEKANKNGISAVPYISGESLNENFLNGKSIMVATYKALFNGKSKFGLRGESNPIKVSGIILDDAHASFSVVREAFTLEVLSHERLYDEISELFRKAFKDIDKLGTFDSVMSGEEYVVLEVPYWAWHQQIDTVRTLLKSESEKYALVWPLLRDNLHLCHVFISRKSISITPIQPLVNLMPTFFEAAKRIYMSATIQDDSDIIKTFGIESKEIKIFSSRSLAGISERMILVPDLMPFEFDRNLFLLQLMDYTKEKKMGSVILVPSDKKAKKWIDKAEIAKGSKETEKFIENLQLHKTYGPLVFSNRYDGVDLPGDSCRFLIMDGLPSGTSNYDLFKSSALFGGNTITKMLSQRIEQGIGRGARGSGDACVVILTGVDLTGWISKKTNFNFLTNATKAQIEIGSELSKEVKNTKELASLIRKSYFRERDWVEYHAEMLDELVYEEEREQKFIDQAVVEVKSMRLWQDGYHEKSISILQEFIKKENSLDNQTIGWLEQLIARIADIWGHTELSENMQESAFAHNRNLIRPKKKPVYKSLNSPGNQACAIVKQIEDYRNRRGLLQTFEEIVVYLNPNATANQFENSLCELAKLIGLTAERHDNNGEGPDVLWLLANKVGFIIEAKSRKKNDNPLTKKEHGQLLIAAEWFKLNYPEYKAVKVSVHPKNYATKAAAAGDSHALTYENLEKLIAAARNFFKSLCGSQLPKEELEIECEKLLEVNGIRYDQLEKNYLQLFEEISDIQ